ncbi:aminotransferase [Ochrobactrum sp. SFR4]|uniref:aminotransferase n=1 Tax=Ochrobactrum sp. SFR4 TaxID=2717368 RepID=UPI001C8B2B4F|nr:aminotransferase [Ochrobactrum sp. SFR4]MBX8825711.1 aminotransferase [Ochrobactrum sp. SFR4]
MSDNAAPRINPAVSALSLPPIPAVKAWAQAYDGALGPLIDLSQAVPGYPPHDEMLRLSGEAASSKAFANYGPIEGLPALREAYAAHVSQLYKAKLDAAQVQITAGCNQAFIAAVMALAGAGDTVMLSNPLYFNHETSLAMLGIKLELMPCRAQNGFVPDPQELKQVLHADIKVLALVTPNNPTGAVYSADVLKQIYEICRANGTWLILDETYRDFLEDADAVPHHLFDEADWNDYLIQLYSFSKSFCIPGHRLGAIIAAEAVISEIAKIMDNLQICAPLPPQAAIAQAIEPLTGWRNENRREITHRAQALRSAIAQMDGWEAISVGAYFAFVRHPFKGIESAAVSEKLAKTCGIITIPGAYFGEGQQDFLRFAFANVDAETITMLPERVAALRF